MLVNKQTHKDKSVQDPRGSGFRITPKIVDRNMMKRCQAFGDKPVGIGIIHIPRKKATMKKAGLIEIPCQLCALMDLKNEGWIKLSVRFNKNTPINWQDNHINFIKLYHKKIVVSMKIFSCIRLLLCITLLFYPAT